VIATPMTDWHMSFQSVEIKKRSQLPCNKITLEVTQAELTQQ